jgi:hypothetical protein
MLIGIWALEGWLIYGVWGGHRGRRTFLMARWIISIIVILARVNWEETLSWQATRLAWFIFTVGVTLAPAVFLFVPTSRNWFLEMRKIHRVAESGGPPNAAEP